MTTLEVKLPKGDVKPFDVEWETADRRENILLGGHDDIRIVGQGRETTFIRQSLEEVTSPNATIHVGQKAKKVTFENLTIETPGKAKTKAIHAGVPLEYGGMQELKPFAVHLHGVDFIPYDTPGTWGLFTYQAEIELEDVHFFLHDHHEHNVYAHGLNGRGALARRCTFRSGGEGFKVRNDPNEILFAPQTMVGIAECDFLQWHGPNAWRGGAGVVLQGCEADVRIVRCDFHGQQNNGRCIAIDNDGGGGGVRTGHVVISRCRTMGKGNEEYNNTTIRCAPGRSDAPVAKSFKLKRTGAFGFGTKVEVGGIQDDYTIEQCNTGPMRRWSEELGDSSKESMIVDGGEFRPLSQGTS